MIFGIIIVNLIAVSYLRMTTGKSLSNMEKDKKDLYLQACLGCRHYFTLMVYSVDIIPTMDTLAAQSR